VQLTHDPLLQTRLVPQVIPLAAERGFVHTDVPVEHEVVPVWQTLPFGVQPAPAVQSTQVPLLHTLLLPHDVPSATFVAFAQVDVPVEQSDVPVLQTLPPGLHVAPAWQAPHVPLLHTCPEPQSVPLAVTPVCVHTAVPVLQSMAPVRHELPPGKHDAPLLQATQPPSLQTWLVPHGLPLATAVEASGSHVDEPDPHDVTAVWHMLPPGLQFDPDVQELQLPLLSQTWFTPQAVPAGALVPRSVQMRPPPEHAADPRWHGFPPGMQGAPAVHGAHTPALQNSLFPHWVPLGALPPSAQTGDPVEHAMAAWPQDPGAAQLEPTGQPTHWPLLQTAPASHSVPDVDRPSVRHVVAPLSSHEVTPMTQASGAHCMPCMHGPVSATAS
jgi:hypothetical protein